MEINLGRIFESAKERLAREARENEVRRSLGGPITKEDARKPLSKAVRPIKTIDSRTR